MSNITIIKILAIVTSITGAVVMLGWILDIGALKTIQPHWVSMKFSTARCFFLSGLTLYLVACTVESKSAVETVLLPISMLITLLIMTTLLTSSLLGIHTGIENWFVKELEIMVVKTVVPGRPSVGTMMAFSFVAIAGLLVFTALNTWHSWLLVIGVMVSLLSGLTFSGYLFDIPILYYSIDGISTAMAFHTAILFALLGTGLVLSRIHAKRSVD